jgi:hypothetical protein
VKTRHLVVLALLAAACCGCRANGFGSLIRPAPVATPGFDVQEVIAQHNREARWVMTYQAEPAVSIKPQPGRLNLIGGAARGSLYVMPPRNFRLTLKAGFQEQVDVGSNEERFWLWSRPLGDVVYTSTFDDSGSIPISALFQPDWLMETLGLVPLPEPGAHGVTVRQDNTDAVLEQRRTGPDGQIAIKETVISGLTRKISEHRLFQLDASGKKVPVARAIVSEYRGYEIPVSGTANEVETVELPASFHLLWPSEQVDLRVQLEQVRINEGFARDQQARLFTVPDRGSEVRDLREALGLAPLQESVEPMRRGTIPVGCPQIRLSEPVARTSAAELSRSRIGTGERSPVERAGLSEPPAPEIPPPPIRTESFVRPELPRPPGQEVSAVIPAWRGNVNRAVVR